MKRSNLIGQRFGKLVVLRDLGNTPRENSIWECLCDCGNKTNVPIGHLVSGHTKSCGCLRIEAKIKHGFLTGQESTTSPELRAYYSARGRCNNPKDMGYKHYGGRGIEFKFDSFKDFISEVGYKPSPKHSLDRINNDGHYEKGNLRWATPEEQIRNRRIRNLKDFSDNELLQEVERRNLSTAGAEEAD